MNVMKIGLAVLVGFALGIIMFRTPTVKAQGAGNIMVFIRPLLMTDRNLPLTMAIPGSRVDGISCISKPIGKLPDAAVCYVATTN